MLCNRSKRKISPRNNNENRAPAAETTRPKHNRQHQNGIKKIILKLTKKTITKETNMHQKAQHQGMIFTRPNPPKQIQPITKKESKRMDNTTTNTAKQRQQKENANSALQKQQQKLLKRRKKHNVRLLCLPLTNTTTTATKQH
jgi:hypothetical protein